MSLIDMIVIVRLSSALLKFRRLFILPSFFCKEKHRKSEENKLFALQGKAVFFVFGSGHHTRRLNECSSCFTMMPQSSFSLLCFSCFFFVRDVSLSLTSFQIIELCRGTPFHLCCHHCQVSAIVVVACLGSRSMSLQVVVWISNE